MIKVENLDILSKASKDAADLYWLSYLLTGRSDLSIEIAVDTAASQGQDSPFFSGWMRSWSRRVAISKALGAIRGELAESARRTAAARSVTPAPAVSAPAATQAQLEKALLAIDVFPRAALLLLIFEGVRTADAATLLEASVELLRKAQAIAVHELTANLAGRTCRAASVLAPVLGTC